MDKDKGQRPSEWITQNARNVVGLIAEKNRNASDQELDLEEIREVINGILQCLDDFYGELRKENL